MRRCKEFLPRYPVGQVRIHENARQLDPTEIHQREQPHVKIKNGYLYMEILRGMYGLPQAGVLANKLLKECLLHGYHETTHTPGLFYHETRPIWFTLVVDDFGIKVVGDTNANHLVRTLEQDYDVTIDWKGELFVGIKLE